MHSEDITNFLNKTRQYETSMTKLNEAAKVQMSIDPRLLSINQVASAKTALNGTPSMTRLVEAVAKFQEQAQHELDLMASPGPSADVLTRVTTREDARGEAMVDLLDGIRAVLTDANAAEAERERAAAAREERMIALNEAAIALNESQYRLNRLQYRLAKVVGAISATALFVALLANHII